MLLQHINKNWQYSKKFALVSIMYLFSQQTAIAEENTLGLPIFITQQSPANNPSSRQNQPNLVGLDNDIDAGGEEFVDEPSYIINENATFPVPSADIDQVELGTVSPMTIARFVRLIDTVRREYVKPIGDEHLFANAMTGVLSELDPYSEYLDKEAFENLRLFTEGDMGSIGVKVIFDNSEKQWVFNEVLPNSPAAKVGIQRLDYLHQINDNKLKDSQTQQEINQLLSGIAGTQVRLTVSNQGRRKKTVILQRTLIEQQSVQAKWVNGVAVVHIPIFQNNTAQQFIDALSRLEQPFSAILIDMRNNPGGVLSSATDIASLFMQNKLVAQIHGRQGLQETIRTHGTPRLEKIPIAVLQNRYSASAAEVLASSLQENDRARIFGETSYGKGSIQSVVPLSDQDALKLTVSNYYSGQGKKIDGIGVKADRNLLSSELYWEQQVIEYLLSQPRPSSYRLQGSNSIDKQEF